jgi:hypothetical protein
MSRQKGLKCRRMLQGAASPTVVIRGLDPPAGPKSLRRGEGPRIHLKMTLAKRMDGRVKPGHDPATSLRAKRSNPDGGEEGWIASSLTLLAMTSSTRLFHPVLVGIVEAASDGTVWNRGAIIRIFLI